MAQPSRLPAWGGGTGARQASQAAASKLRTVRDVVQTRSSASSGGSLEDRRHTSASAGWGSSTSRAGSQEDEGDNVSATPASTPVKLVTPSKGGEARGPGSARMLGSTPFEHGCEEQPACAGAAPSSSRLPPTASAALERLASKLGAVAGSGNTLELCGPTWEEAFLAGVAVGMQLHQCGAGRRSWPLLLLLSILAVAVLAAVAASVLLLRPGWSQDHVAPHYG
ncbi:hypothetical protein ACK3TF_000619 [Chlorella vulgaris]